MSSKFAVCPGLGTRRNLFVCRVPRYVGKFFPSKNGEYITFIQHFFNDDMIHSLYMQDFYRCDEGYEERAAIVADNRCVKLVKDIHYEAQVQCVINFCALFLKQKIGKPEARELKLTREQYLQVSLSLF